MDDRPLTNEEIKQLGRNLALLSRSGVEEAYKQAHKDCAMKGDTLPRPVCIQQLVQAWKQLWTWRKK